MTASTSSDPSEAEALRQAALARYEVVDSAGEPVFDDVAMLAHLLCGTPLAGSGWPSAT